MEIFLLIVFLCFVIIGIRIYIESTRRKLFDNILDYIKMDRKSINLLERKFDKKVIVKSRASLEKYDSASLIKEDINNIKKIEKVLEEKKKIREAISEFLKDNPFTNEKGYSYVRKELMLLSNVKIKYIVSVEYITSAGNNLANKKVSINLENIKYLKQNPQLYLTKTAIKEIEKNKLEEKKKEFYKRVDRIIDLANGLKDNMIIKKDTFVLDLLIEDLFNKTINSIQKIKNLDSEEWNLINKIIEKTDEDVKKIKDKNDRLEKYYQSSSFKEIKATCELLMKSQSDFNEYIEEKINSLSEMFGTRVSRNETINEDNYNYVRAYKKTITPFTAELSSNVFASAENNPIQYLIKLFYPNKALYEEQICGLKNLLNELETLKDAKAIIDNYKKDYSNYVKNVPSYVLEDDEDGFYSRLGFVVIDENVLNVQYKFVYTSNGGMAQRYFTIPMNEETISELINQLQNKLSLSTIAKEQRALMTPKLRTFIKKRDNYSCCACGNSSYKEPNLLLEIDHIVPISKGGLTIENNLQTLCWKCNRKKGSKLV